MDKPWKPATILPIAMASVVMTLALSSAIVFTLDNTGSVEQGVLDSMSGTRAQCAGLLRLRGASHRCDCRLLSSVPSGTKTNEPVPGCVRLMATQIDQHDSAAIDTGKPLDKPLLYENWDHFTQRNHLTVPYSKLAYCNVHFPTRSSDSPLCSAP
jgi:hypothetical protein